MNARLDTAVTHARAALSDPDQEELAEIIAAYTLNHADPLDLTDLEMAELGRRNDEPFDPAPEAEVREFFARHRG